MVILYGHELILMNDISGAMKPSLPDGNEKAFLIAPRGKLMIPALKGSCSPRHDAFSFIYLYLPYPNGKAVQTIPACTAFSCVVLEISCVRVVFSI